LQRKVNVLVGDDARKSLGDVARLEYGGHKHSVRET
jgi:hypothetical protein